MTKLINKQANGRQVYICLPFAYSANTSYKAVYIHSDARTQKTMEEIFQEYSFPFISVMIISENRQNDYTPWPEESLNENYPGFGGKGNEYLEWIMYSLKPMLEEEYAVSQSALVGRSLGGLFNLYALCKTNLFNEIACISPSVWYPNFTEYISNTLPCKDSNVLIVAGKNEGANKDNIQRFMTQNIQSCFSIIGSRINGKNELTLDEGGHHDFVKERYLQCLKWILR